MNNKILEYIAIFCALIMGVSYVIILLRLKVPLFFSTLLSPKIRQPLDPINKKLALIALIFFIVTILVFFVDIQFDR